METKIQLSADEWSLVTNAEILLTKNRLMEKLAVFLGELAEISSGIFSAESVMLPLPLPWKHPKISKGENYKGLPYLVLDYPRFFFKDDVFAIRTMFWWGNYFSITVHFKGVFCEHFSENILDNRALLESSQFLVNITSTEWNHAISEEEYKPFSEFGNEEILHKLAVDRLLKLAVKIPLQEPAQAGESIIRYYRILAIILNVSFRDGEKGL